MLLACGMLWVDSQSDFCSVSGACIALESKSFTLAGSRLYRLGKREAYSGNSALVSSAPPRPRHIKLMSHAQVFQALDGLRWVQKGRCGGRWQCCAQHAFSCLQALAARSALLPTSLGSQRIHLAAL